MMEGIFDEADDLGRLEDDLGVDVEGIELLVAEHYADEVQQFDGRHLLIIDLLVLDLD